MELTDSEICKRIAEIEGLRPKVISGFVITTMGEFNLFDKEKTHRANKMQTYLLGLLFKHKIDLIFNEDGSCSAYYNKKYCITRRSPRKAVCLAIIKANK